MQGRCASLLIWLLISATACQSKETHPEVALYFDGNGYPIADLPQDSECADNAKAAPTGWSVIKDDEAGRCWQQYESKILDGARASKKRILVFIHGGLNSLEDGRARVERLLKLGYGDGTLLSAYYPIFINWQASLFSSYLDHLANVRQGARQPLLARTTSAFVFLKDVVVGAVRIIPDTAELVSDSLPMYQPKRLVCFEPPSEPNAYRLRRDPSLCKGDDGLHEVDYRWGRDIRSRPKQAADWLVQVPFLPIKPVSTGLVIDGLGSESWQIMIRRTELMFHQEGLAPVSSKSADSRTLTAFLEKLKEVVEGSSDGTFDIVAHSAGTLVLNRALREIPDLPVKNIVYMAAATSIEDYENIVLGDGVNTGFLTRHRDANVYHLLLHPTAEIHENDLGFFELQPRGSLLYWIDTFLTEPQYLRQRTLGRADNLTARIEATPPLLRPRVHLKIFDFGVPSQPSDRNKWYSWCTSNRTLCQPQRHGDFGEAPFWEPWFWKPNGN